MVFGWIFWYSVLGITSVILVFALDVLRRKISRLPPGPPGLPIVGNMFQLGKKPNESLSHLATKYGPLMSLSFGMKTTVVASSAAMAKEVLKTHDHLLASRPITQASKPLTQSSLSFGQIGPRWRLLRRISTTELFSVKKIEALQHLRRDQVYQTIRQIFEDAMKGKCVNIGHAAFNLTANLLGNMIFGTEMSDPHSRVSQELRESIDKLLELHAAPNLADSFPFLQWFCMDPHGISRTAGIHRRKVYAILDKFIQDHLATRGKSSSSGSDSEKDLLDVLLDMRSDEFTISGIKIYLIEILGAGTDTSATTIEWAMAELLRNPQIMERAQAEWNEPSKFIPERFIGDDVVEYKGQHFELIPFGAGRRMCAGFPLATRMIHLVLASLIHSFDWEPPKGVSPDEVDMNDKYGMTLHKVVQLEANPTPRLPYEIYN